jgi:ketosteroid isomerase-like protein
MSQENLEIVRRAFAAYSSGGPEALADFWDPEIEVEVPPGLAEAGTYRGREAVLAWMSEWSEAWERIEYTPEEIVGNGDTVVVTLLYDGVGRGSGLRKIPEFFSRRPTRSVPLIPAFGPEPSPRREILRGRTFQPSIGSARVPRKEAA